MIFCPGVLRPDREILIWSKSYHIQRGLIELKKGLIFEDCTSSFHVVMDAKFITTYKAKKFNLCICS